MPDPFIITVDTEGDDLWGDNPEDTTENAHFLPRFQNLCFRYGFRPTYLVDYEMAKADWFMQWLHALVEGDRCEVGMHLHSWNTPPRHPLDCRTKKRLLHEYPDNAMRAKMVTMTDLLGQYFGRRPTSHRGGRWSFSDTMGAILKDLGYTVDCSMAGGPARRLACGLLEVGHQARPNGSNVDGIVRLLKTQGDGYLHMMIHSSELMECGSPYFRTPHSIESLYADLNAILSTARDLCYDALTLSEFASTAQV